MAGQKKTLGLALGGGGMRGTAHIGVLEVLYENGIDVDVMAGTSVGSLVGGLFASGYTPHEMHELAVQLSRHDLYDYAIGLPSLALVVFQGLASWFGLRLGKLGSKAPTGFIKGQRLERLVQNWTDGRSFHDLKLPLAVLSADVVSAETVVFAPPEMAPRLETGLPGSTVLTGQTLAEAVRASVAIPGVFQPKVVGDRLLVDGGLKGEVPVDVLHHMGADVVVAVDLGYHPQPHNIRQNIFEILSLAASVLGRELSELKVARYADLVMRPLVFDVGLSQVDRVEYCIEKGRKAAEKALPDLLRLLDAAPAAELLPAPVSTA
jgi:NTE family protein